MQAIKIEAVVERDGELHLSNLPCRKGERVEAIVLIAETSDSDKEWNRLTAEQFLKGYADTDAIYDDVPGR